MSDFGTWPFYSDACRKDMDELLRAGGSLSAYRANREYGAEPARDSWAWRLEREVEKRFHVRHAVATNSGTAALHAALVALDLRGGEVVTSPYTFSATASAILMAGGVPVFADVNPETYCITERTVKRAITRRTRAILPVSLFGRMADIRGLRSLGLPVCEDACQAVGARDIHGYSGTQGVVGCYSFNGGKQLPAGEAGCLVTNSSKIAHQARLLMNHGENFGKPWVGYNYRPNELTACVAYHGLLELEERNRERQRLAGVLNEARYLDFIKEGLTRTFDYPPGSHVFYVYPFRVPPGTRARFARRMRMMDVPVGEGYITPPLHRYKAFRQYQRGPLPVVEELSAKTLCLFSHVRPPATEEDMRYTAECMRKALCE